MSGKQHQSATPESTPAVAQVAAQSSGVPQQDLVGNQAVASTTQAPQRPASSGSSLPWDFGVSSLVGGGWFGSQSPEETATVDTSEAGATDAEACGEGASFTEQAECIFSTLDTDGDGYVSEEELDSAATATGEDEYTGADAVTIATLRRYRTNLEELSDDEYFDENSGVTLADLRAYGEALAKLREDGTPIPEELGGLGYMFQSSTDRLNGSSPELVGEDGPDLASTHQGSIGSCSFHAAVGGMLDQGRGQDLMDMISENDDGTYTVTFPGAEAVTVNAPTETELAMGATAGANGQWLTILEKAYGRSRDADAGMDVDGAPGSLVDAISTLTGNDTNRDLTAFTSESTHHERLQDALNNGRIVTASNMGDTVQGIPGKHAYTVMHYDPESQTVTLRNPWGSPMEGTNYDNWGERTNPDGQTADGDQDGVFTVTLEEFDDIFRDVAYEEASD